MPATKPRIVSLKISISTAADAPSPASRVVKSLSSSTPNRQDDGHADYEDLQHLVDTLHGLVPEQVGIAGDGVQRGYELIDQAGPDDDKVDIECLGNEGSPVLAGIEQRQGDEKSHRRYQMENVVQDLASGQIVVPLERSPSRNLPYHRDQQLAAQKVHEIRRDHQSAGDDHPHLLTEIQ